MFERLTLGAIVRQIARRPLLSSRVLGFHQFMPAHDRHVDVEYEIDLARLDIRRQKLSTAAERSDQMATDLKQSFKETRTASSSSTIQIVRLAQAISRLSLWECWQSERSIAG